MSLLWIILAAAALAAVHFAGRAKLRRERVECRAQLEQCEARAKAAAAEAFARQDALFNSMIEGVLLLDENDCVQFANRTFAEMFSAPGDLRGRTLLEAVRLHEVAEIVHQTRETDRETDRELHLPGEMQRWLQINAAAVTDASRRRLGTILVFHDLTRLKQLENTRAEFVANVSHELRTPLTMIKGYVETLLSGAKDDPATAERFLQTVERHANRLTLLIEDLLTLSSLESRQMDLRLETVPLPAAVEKVFNDLNPRAEARRVALQNRIPPLLVHADADRLHQVLSNLVDNAIKYGRTGGKVTVDGRLTGDGQVVVSVQDDGPGIPEESLPRIFERFYRVDKARSREQGGTGLGLAIVKHIVQAHGGKAWAASEPDKGATFHFTLPKATAGTAGGATGQDR